jgi:hypothetical protein
LAAFFSALVFLGFFFDSFFRSMPLLMTCAPHWSTTVAEVTRLAEIPHDGPAAAGHSRGGL